MPANTSPRHRWRERLGTAISIIALGGVIWWASQQKIPSLPSSATSLELLIGALLVYALATAARGWRWHRILRLDGIDHQAVDAYGLVVVGYMGNTVLPARGGELLRILLLGERTTARRREILGSIIAERVLDVVVLVALFGVLTIVGVAGRPAGTLPAVLGTAALVCGSSATAVYLYLRRRGRFEGFASRVRPISRQTKLLASPTGLMLAIATFLIWLMEGVIFLLVARSLEVDISLVEGLFLTVLTSFFALIPAAPGYVGTFDAAVIFGARALGMSKGTAVTYTLLIRVILFVPITFAGLVLVLTRYGGLGHVRQVLRRRDALALERA